MTTSPFEFVALGLAGATLAYLWQKGARRLLIWLSHRQDIIDKGEEVQAIRKRRLESLT